MLFYSSPPLYLSGWWCDLSKLCFKRCVRAVCKEDTHPMSSKRPRADDHSVFATLAPTAMLPLET